MASIAIFYGTNQGHTRSVAERVAAAFGEPAPALVDVKQARAVDLVAHDKLVLGAPTWGVGELDDSWEQLLPDLADVSLDGKTVALFGLGDQRAHPESFVDSLAVLYEAATARGAQVVGDWPTDGYEFLLTSAVRDGRFVGLAIDEVSQPDLTDDRIARWVARVREAFAGGAS
jgi:flavodoxin I